MSSTDHASWPLPPLIPGDWKTLSGPDATALIARYAVAESEIALDQVSERGAFARVRACPLVCAPRWLLVEAEARLPDGAFALLTFFFGPERRIRPVVWAPYAIAELFWESQRMAADLEAIRNFLLLAVNCTVGEDARFRLLDSAAELPALAAGPEPVPDELTKAIRAVTVENRADGYAARGTVIYGDSVFQSEFSLSATGELQMTDDNLIRELPTRREHFFGPFRIAAGP